MSVKIEAKKTFNEMSSGFSSFCYQVASLPLATGSHNCYFSFLIDVFEEVFLAVLDILGQINSRWALAFLVSFLLTVTAPLYSLQMARSCFHLL